MNSKKKLSASLLFLFAFIVWTLLVSFVDVQPIGPRDSCVGFATVNGFFHNLTGVNMTLYSITDWLGLVPIFVALSFAILGLVQWIKRKSILEVDRGILLLGVYYIVVIFFYVLFEYVVINYRPVLINDFLEASYPSSTTLLVLTVMPAAIIQLTARIKAVRTKICIRAFIIAFIVFMVLGRLISGVHWLTDILGGALLSAGLVLMYSYLFAVLTDA
jgi:undecaprenyl-diphosphatase